MSADLKSLDFLVCRYSCHVCGIVDAKVFVPARGSDEDCFGLGLVLPRVVHSVRRFLSPVDIE
jgi:hypothetical protein